MVGWDEWRCGWDARAKRLTKGVRIEIIANNLSTITNHGNENERGGRLKKSFFDQNCTKQLRFPSRMKWSAARLSWRHLQDKSCWPFSYLAPCWTFAELPHSFLDLSGICQATSDTSTVIYLIKNTFSFLGPRNFVSRPRQRAGVVERPHAIVATGTDQRHTGCERFLPGWLFCPCLSWQK